MFKKKNYSYWQYNYDGVYQRLDQAGYRSATKDWQIASLLFIMILEQRFNDL